jgi:hypothetical protein
MHTFHHLFDVTWVSEDLERVLGGTASCFHGDMGRKIGVRWWKRKQQGEEYANK